MAIDEYILSGLKKTYLDLYHVRVTSNSFMKRKKRDAELKLRSLKTKISPSYVLT